MLAINEWLRRLRMGKDEVVPEEILSSSTLYDGAIYTRFGGVPNRQMGVPHHRGQRQDARRYRADASLRKRTAGVLPESYAAPNVRPLDDLMARFGEVLRAVSPRPDPTIAVLRAQRNAPERFDAADKPGV